jgi:hypothetical protein
LWYNKYMVRKCVYTDKEAKSKDSIIPRELLGEEIHNWSASLPSNSDYIQTKQNRLPTELEMQANEIFHLLELTKLRVTYYEHKLKSIQGEILKDYKEPKKSPVPKIEKKKQEEIKKAIIEKEVVESTGENIDSFFESKRKIWDDEDE